MTQRKNWGKTYQTAGSDSSGEPVTVTLARSCHAQRQNEQRHSKLQLASALATVEGLVRTKHSKGKARQARISVVSSRRKRMVTNRNNVAKLLLPSYHDGDIHATYTEDEGMATGRVHVSNSRVVVEVSSPFQA